MAFRLDTGEIYKSETTPEGFLRFYANFSKVGALQYLRADGSIQIEHVTEAELFRDDSLQTAALQPITLLHPEGGRVTADNARQFQRGTTGDRIVKNYPYATIVGVVTDRETIDAIQSGTNQISAGYTCKLRQRTDGSFEQYDRVYNHHAVVPLGRAGADVRIHIDAEDDFAIQIAATESEGIKESNSDQRREVMTIVNLNNRVYNIDGADAPLLADAIAILATQADTSKTEVTTQTKRADAAEAKLEIAVAEKSQLTQKLDAAESTRLDADQVAVEAAARMQTWEVVLPLLRVDAADYKADYSLPVAGIRKLAIAKKYPEIKLDSKSPEQIEAMWELCEPDLKSAAETRTDSSADLLGLVKITQRQDAGNAGTKVNPIAQRRKDKSKMPAC
jgi:hypothetical protein